MVGIDLKCQEFAWLPWCCAVQICGCLSVWMVLAVCTCCRLSLMIGCSCSLRSPCQTSSRKSGHSRHHQGHQSETTPQKDIDWLEFHPKELVLHVLQMYVCALLQIMHQVVSVCPVSLWGNLTDGGENKSIQMCTWHTVFAIQKGTLKLKQIRNYDLLTSAMYITFCPVPFFNVTVTKAPGNRADFVLTYTAPPAEVLVGTRLLVLGCCQTQLQGWYRQSFSDWTVDCVSHQSVLPGYWIARSFASFLQSQHAAIVHHC